MQTMRLLRLVRSIALLAGGLTAFGCASGSSLPPPSDPESSVRAFMNAVNANSLAAMGELFGGRRGLARGYIPSGELEQRLTVMRIYLEHQEYEILPPGSVPGPQEGQRTVRVRLTRRGCMPVVPFTLTQWGQGWLVTNVDLAAAGNPARTCAPGEPGRGS
jgi:hypothetical protein